MSAVPPALRLSAEVSIANVIKKRLLYLCLRFFLHFSAKSFVVDKGIAGLGDAVGKISTRLQGSAAVYLDSICQFVGILP